MDKPFIAAFDIATATGVCYGVPGSVPAVWTWELAGQSRAGKLADLRRKLDEFFSSSHVDLVQYEAPVPLAAMMRIGAREETIALLRGAIGVLEACANYGGIIVEAVSVQDARQALTGQRTFSKVAGKSTAKTAVMQWAKVLGVDTKNDHEADAYAIWWRACALRNPRTAHLSQPLFAGRS